MLRPALLSLGALGVVATIAGALGPWSVWTRPYSGQTSGLDLRGAWLLVLPTVALALSSLRSRVVLGSVVVAALGVVVAGLALRDLSWVDDPGGTRIDPGAGWGLYLFVGGALATAAAATVRAIVAVVPHGSSAEPASPGPRPRPPTRPR